MLAVIRQLQLATAAYPCEALISGKAAILVLFELLLQEQVSWF